VTNCTGRKRQASTSLQLSDLNRQGTASCLAANWVTALKGSAREHAAKEFYVGRGFSEVLKTADYLGSSIAIVSAGLGLISGDEKIPSYDLTVTEGKNNVLKLMNSPDRTSMIWWQALQKELGVSRPFEKMISEHLGKIILIALPSTYLAMIEHELQSLPSAMMSRLRIFTSELGRRSMSTQLQKQAMPYDERLETTSYSGTRSDFPQRSLRHFVMQLCAESLSVSEASVRVMQSLEHQKWRLVPDRVKKTDEQIIDCLNVHWNAYGGASGRLLRCLRDDLGVACEQSRFRLLWKQVQELKSRRSS
jgi:hypothetical protein